MSFASLAPALSVIPPTNDDGVLKDHREELQRDTDLDLYTMHVLDALAAVCVRDPDSAFAVTLELSSPSLTVSVASNAATEDARDRLRFVWKHMLVAGSNAVHNHLVRRKEEMPQELLDRHRAFIASQYRYSLPALRHRARNDIHNVALLLDQVATNYTFRRSELACAPGFSGRLSIEQRSFVQDLAKELQSIVREILETEENDQSLNALHNALKKLEMTLRVELASIGKAPHGILFQIHRATGVPILHHLHNLFRLVLAVQKVVAFSHSHAFSRLRGFGLNVVTVPSQQTRVRIDPDDQLLRRKAESVYTPEWDDVSPYFENDFQTNIIEPLQVALQNLPMQLRPTAEHNLFTTQIHPECALLAFVHDFPGRTIPYIGTSELSCLLCYQLVKAHNTVCPHPMFIRGSHGMTPLAWGPPTVVCHAHDTVLEGFYARIRVQFELAVAQSHDQSRAERAATRAAREGRLED